MRWRHRGRPPWWPEDEPWPPTDAAPWRRMRRRFLWRLVLGAVVFMIVAAGLFTLIGWLLGRAFDGGLGHLLAALVPILIIVAVVVIVVRTVRGAAAPMGDLIEAAGRVEQGDFSTRLPERGPAELRSVAGAFNAMSARLEANEEARRRLFADVSHELRTPLAVIQGNLEGVLDGVYPPDAEHLRPILEETRLLARLIDDLRTLSMAEGGALRLDRALHDIAPLLADAAIGFAAQAATAGVTISTRADGELPPVRVDPQRLREILANLLANALRATPRGGRIEIIARRDGDAVLVEVRDTGRGIDPEFLPRVFDRFSRSADGGGSGLGLAIVRGLVEAHGGTISAESTSGRGTTIRFTVPMA